MKRAAVFLALLVAACGPTTPTPPTLKVTAISPPSGSTTGGTSVTITGTEFTSDATVTIGGLAATDVKVLGATSLSAVAAPRPASGPADVVVTSAGKSAALTNGFTYVAPGSANQPPVVTSIRSIGSRPNQPANFADVNETITLVATIADNETAADQLTYEWSGPGSFSTPTPTTAWQIPDVGTTPATMSVSLKVTERFVEGGVTHTNVSATASYSLQVHNSQKEILDMGEDFLTLFSNSTIPTSQVLRNFSKTCDDGKGYEDEKEDVDQNRDLYTHDTGAFRIQRRGPATINFRSVCVLPDGRVQANVDGCASYAVHWEVIKKSTGAREVTNGVDYVSAVVENNQWRLCHSSFIQSAGFPSLGLR